MLRLMSVLLFCAACAAAARPASFAPNPYLRQLQQAGQGNCTQPQPLTATNLPYCFQPPTASAEARQFLSSSAPGKTPASGSSQANASDQAAMMATLLQAREWYKQSNAPLHAAAVQQHLQSTSNTTIANVSVVVGVPKGVDEKRPGNTKVLLYLHGGGYLIGSCSFLLNTVAATAAAANLTIVCPEYRLAPEHPFPAGLNDALAVYKGLLKEGYKPGNIVFLGDSAGGGMVAAMAIQLQREGEPLPAALGMFSPWSDLTGQGDTQVTLNGVDPVLAGRDPTRSSSADSSTGSLADGYVAGNTSLLQDPLVSPVLADYAALFKQGALPPTLMQVGLRETLLSDAVRLYHKMKAAAPAPGHVVISPYEGMWHVFQAYINVPEAAVASKEMADYFSRALKGGICK